MLHCILLFLPVYQCFTHARQLGALCDSEVWAKVAFRADYFLTGIGITRNNKESSKEGRKYYICSSRLGLIRWDIIQHVKAVHHKVSNTSDVQLPHELLHRASTIGKQCSILITHSNELFWERMHRFPSSDRWLWHRVPDVYCCRGPSCRAHTGASPELEMETPAVDVYLAYAAEQKDFAELLRILLVQAHHLSVFGEQSLEPGDPTRDIVQTTATAAAVGKRCPGAWLCRAKAVPCRSPSSVTPLIAKPLSLSV